MGNLGQVNNQNVQLLHKIRREDTVAGTTTVSSKFLNISLNLNYQNRELGSPFLVLRMGPGSHVLIFQGFLFAFNSLPISLEITQPGLLEHGSY